MIKFSYTNSSIIINIRGMLLLYISVINNEALEMKPEKFKKLMRAQGHWRNRSEPVAESPSYTRIHDIGQVELCVPAKGFWVDGSPPTASTLKRIAIDINGLDRDIFVRVTKGANALNNFQPIEHTSEGASLKAFNMDENDARHLFSVFDGLTYPMQNIDGYYNFVSNKIYKAKNWVNGKESTRNIKIESAPFPGYLGNTAAREVFRNASGFSITSEDVLSIPISLIQGMYYGLLNGCKKNIEITYTNEMMGRTAIFHFDLKEVFNCIKTTEKWTEMLIKDDIFNFISTLPNE